MRKMTARELKNETGQALDWAACGERVLITRRGKPVAWLVQACQLPDQDETGAEADWNEIELALKSAEPHFQDWQSATALSRGRP